MIGCQRALAGADLQTRLILTIHDELLFEGPEDEAGAVRGLVEREMVAPWEPREPPLAVDVGAGRTWLEAK
jgi:DNA polymerase I